MKVQGTDPLGRLRDLLNRAQEGDAVGQAERGRGARPGGAADGDSVQLSAAARELNGLRDLMAATPETREQLVSALRDEIASGRYYIDGTHVAEELLREAAELTASEAGTDGDS